MASPVDTGSGLLACVAFALQSTRALYLAIASVETNLKIVRELKYELETLSGALEQLETAVITDSNLAMLQHALLGCGRACKDYEEVFHKFIAHSGGLKIDLESLGKLRYMGNNIFGFKKLLADYKRTMLIAVSHANMCNYAVSAKVLEENKDMIEDTTNMLEKRLQDIDDRIHALALNDLTTSGEIAVETRQIQEERDFSQQCLRVCAEAVTQLHTTRTDNFEDGSRAEEGSTVVFSSLEDLVSSLRDTAGSSRSRSISGHMSDASLRQLLQDGNDKLALDTGDDSSTSGLSEHDSALSIASLADSIFSTTSGSSKSSVIGPAGAGERLIALLLTDDQLSMLYQDGLKRVTADKFERNFRRILQKFARELRNEAKNPQQRSIASFVRYRARNSAHLVRNSICSPEKPQEVVTLDFKARQETVDIESDESDNDTEPDNDDSTDLQQLEDFIITSQAFVELRRNLRSFIYPINLENIDSKVNAELVDENNNERELCEQAPHTNLEKAYMTGSAVYPKTDVIECSDLLNSQESPNENLAILRNCKSVNEDTRSSRWHVPRFMTQFGEFWEPQVPEGKVRVRWECKCGQSLYDDYIELQPGAAKRLEESLNQRLREGGTVPTSRGLALLTTVGGLISDMFKRVRHALLIKDQELPLRQLPPTACTQHLATPQPRLAEALFLLICHNVSIYDKKLLQLSVCDIESDEKFFRALKKHYRSKYNNWWSFVSLRTITGIKFVKFELYRKSQSVDVRLKNDIPPPENPNYCYVPVPVDLIPPVGEERLMHLFNNPDCAEDVLACLSRFPKKIREKLSCGDKAIAPGWGLHLEEGVCKFKTAILYIVCVLGSSIWGILWTVLGHDIQGAFTVSTYMIGITVPLITLMQYIS